jgi:hypothetical protein
VETCDCTKVVLPVCQCLEHCFHSNSVMWLQLWLPVIPSQSALNARQSTMHQASMRRFLVFASMQVLSILYPAHQHHHMPCFLDITCLSCTACCSGRCQQVQQHVHYIETAAITGVTCPTCACQKGRASPVPLPDCSLSAHASIDKQGQTC